MGCAAVSLHRHPQGLIGIHIFFYGRSVTGSRHKCGHNGAIILIYLDFLCIKLPCAMVLRLMPGSPRRRIHLASVAGGLKDCSDPVGSTHLRRLDTSNGCRDHTVLPYAASRLRLEASPGTPVSALRFIRTLAPVVCALCPLTDDKPALRPPHAPDAAASTAPVPRS
jgi:hypothetical protein